MNWLVLLLSLQGGLVNGGSSMSNGDSFIHLAYPGNSIEFTTGAEFIFLDHLAVGGTITSYQVQDGPQSFKPWKIDYSIHAEARLDGFALGIRHSCNHTIRLDDSEGSSPQGSMGWTWDDTELYLRYQAKINIF